MKKIFPFLLFTSILLLVACGDDSNDYNLNKVAGVTGVPVLNINELAGALRPQVLPGEEMTVHIVREGKEPGRAWPTWTTAPWWWWKTAAAGWGKRWTRK